VNKTKQDSGKKVSELSNKEMVIFFIVFATIIAALFIFGIANNILEWIWAVIKELIPFV